MAEETPKEMARSNLDERNKRLRGYKYWDELDSPRSIITGLASLAALVSGEKQLAGGLALKGALSAADTYEANKAEMAGDVDEARAELIRADQSEAETIRMGITNGDIDPEDYTDDDLANALNVDMATVKALKARSADTKRLLRDKAAAQDYWATRGSWRDEDLIPNTRHYMKLVGYDQDMFTDEQIISMHREGVGSEMFDKVVSRSTADSVKRATAFLAQAGLDAGGITEAEYAQAIDMLVPLKTSAELQSDDLARSLARTRALQREWAIRVQENPGMDDNQIASMLSEQNRTTYYSLREENRPAVADMTKWTERYQEIRDNLLTDGRFASMQRDEPGFNEMLDAAARAQMLSEIQTEQQTRRLITWQGYNEVLERAASHFPIGNTEGLTPEEIADRRAIHKSWFDRMAWNSYLGSPQQDAGMAYVDYAELMIAKLEAPKEVTDALDLLDEAREPRDEPAPSIVEDARARTAKEKLDAAAIEKAVATERDLAENPDKFVRKAQARLVAAEDKQQAFFDEAEELLTALARGPVEESAVQELVDAAIEDVRTSERGLSESTRVANGQIMEAIVRRASKRLQTRDIKLRR